MRWPMLIRVALLGVAAALPLATHAAARADTADAKAIARGKYLVVITGCNDCHTAGYLLANGNLPEKEWLTGNALGWRGPWGTTYPINVRQYMQALTEAQWVAKAKTLQVRPPMPWWNVRAMSIADLRALYRYIRHLGPGGEAAPAYLPPDKEPPPPYITVPAPPN